MDQFFEFFARHPLLVAAFFVILGMLAWTFVGTTGTTRRVSAVAATRMINHEDAVVLNIRGDSEFAEGHIVNAVHVPLDRLSDQPEMLEKFRDRPIIVVCRTGRESVAAGKILRKHGFEKVYSVNGGILAWQEANLPLTKK